MKTVAQKGGSIADHFDRIETYRSNKRSFPVLEVNKDLGDGIPREPLLVSRDDLMQINLGYDESTKFVSVNRSLDEKLRLSLETLLVECKDIFTWDYTEMPGLDRELVEIVPRRLTPQLTK